METSTNHLTTDSVPFRYNKLPVAPVNAAKSLQCYEFDDERENIALIFNQYDFEKDGKPDDKSKNRKGSEIDCAVLDNTLKQLGFTPTIRKDLTVEQIKEEIKMVAIKTKEEVNCVVIVMMSHGSSEDFIRAKDKQFRCSELLQTFEDSSNNLDGIPKIVIVQACRGLQSELAVKNLNFSPDCMGPCNDRQHIFPMIDILWMYSTFDDYKSWRSDTGGSWFIRVLCDALDMYGGSLDMLEILTRVNFALANFEVISNEHGGLVKQMSEIQFTLTKELRFRKLNEN